MHYEVEAKIRVKDPEKMRKKIKKIARFVKKTTKTDLYFKEKSIKGYPSQRFRIRKEGKKTIATFKTSRRPALIYAKKEHEFNIDDEKGFIDFLDEFDFKPFVKKIKYSETYNYKGTNIELNKVKSLGWFAEIEVLCERKNQISPAREKVKQVFKLLDIKKEDIEPKGYTWMLYKKK
ncbi:class IV adenylate cyclase [Nanoarchaeota archaeon]